jgi:taurine dioxygenase
MSASERSHPGLQFSELTSFMGAEVHGVDLNTPLSETNFADLRHGLAEFSLLLIRDQDMIPESQIAFSRRFGELEDHVLQDFCLDGHPEIFVVSNIIENSKHIGAYGGSKSYHSDLAYIEKPSLGSVFHCLECTEEGGETAFVSMYAVHDGLPEEKRAWLTEQKAVFDYPWNHEMYNSHRPPLTQEQIDSTPPIAHPCVRTHPETGRRAAFFSPIWIRNFEGMSEEESQPILMELCDFATQEQFTYTHTWRPGDVLIWDNRSSMHKAMPFDEENARRLMHRTTICGDRPYLDT